MTKETKEPYFRVTVKPLADGSYRAVSFRQLRELDPEVKRIYENGVPHIRVHCGEVFLGGDGANLQGKLPKRIFQRDLELLREAHARLLAVEADVERLACRRIDLYVGGYGQISVTSFGPGSKALKVVDCKHTDGSVYSWRIRPDDKTEYAVGDIVEVEHLGCYRNEFLPIVEVRLLNFNEKPPACEVVRRVDQSTFLCI